MQTTATTFAPTFAFLAALATTAAAQEVPPILRGLLEQTCFECHNEESGEGDLDLSSLPWTLDDQELQRRWVQIHDRIDSGEMPPDEGVLSDADRAKLLASLANPIRQFERDRTRMHGRGPLRRLTRTEYEDNLRDLLHLPYLDIVDRLPADRRSRGFTRVSSMLDISRVQLGGYLDAAEAALQQAVATSAERPEPNRDRFTGTDLFPALNTFGGPEAMFFAKDGKRIKISSSDYNKLGPEQRRDSELELALFRSATWPYYGYPRGFVAKSDGSYRVRFSARAVRQLPGFRLVPAHDPLPISFRARKPSGPDVSGDVRETGGWIDLLPEAKVFETTIQLKAGETFEYSLLGLPVPFIRTDGGFFYDYPPMPPDGHRGAAIQSLEVTGPLMPAEWPPASHRLLFGDLPIRQSTDNSGDHAIEVVSEHPKRDARRLFGRFARRAARQPIDAQTQQVFIDLIHTKLGQGAPLVDAMLEGYQAFLCSGHFLYLSEPKNDPFATAQRLSHLLWNSRPDDALWAKATDGSLNRGEVLQAETDRMIADERFERFIENFADQWLDLRHLRRDIADIRLYPEYREDDYLVDSMQRETQAFVTAMIRENLPVTMLVDADFAFVNDRLAAHYGLSRQPGSSLRRIALPAWSPYGGLLTQASVLKLTANGTTTSPVLRGVWVMEKLIGQPPPPPPKSVPAIAPDIRGASTIRDLLSKHTESESCAMCHARFDPVGFALENFDVMGAWRDRYRGLEQGEKITGIDRAGHPFKYHVGPDVDASGKLRTGESFDDVRELKSLLAANPRQLAHNWLSQLTLYATGTPVRFSDRKEIESMLDQCEAEGYRVTDLIHTLVASEIFRGR